MQCALHAGFFQFSCIFFRQAKITILKTLKLLDKTNFMIPQFLLTFWYTAGWYSAAMNMMYRVINPQIGRDQNTLLSWYDMKILLFFYIFAGLVCIINGLRPENFSKKISHFFFSRSKHAHLSQKHSYLNNKNELLGSYISNCLSHTWNQKYNK